MKLYDYWRSSASYRVRIALALKGVEYERVPVDLVAGAQRGEANRTVNPQGLVPTLVTNDGTAIAQSLAIVDWLDGTYPEPRLIPVDQPARAKALAMTMVVAADIHPLDNLRVLKRLESQFGADQAARDDWYRHWIALGFEALEAMADPMPYLGGALPAIADVFLVPQFYNARRLSVDLTPYPKLVAADAAATALPEFQAAHPDRVKPG